MEFRKIAVGKLRQNTGQIEGLPANPRQWTKRDLDNLKASIEGTPQLLEARGAIVYPHGGEFIVLGGNMRLAAVRELGWKEMPCIVLPEDTPVERLREIVLKDNGSFGDWDTDAIANEWDDFPLKDWGVKIYGIESPELQTRETRKAIDDSYDLGKGVGKANKHTITKRGDIIQLGEHLLICADTSDLEALQKLMGGGIELADLLVTDPPYNVAITNSDGKTIENDNMSDDAYREFLYNCFAAINPCLKAGAGCYVWMASSEIDACIEAYEKAGLLYKQLLIWVKNCFTLGRQDYQWQHESCVYGWKAGAAHYFTDSRRESTVFEDKPDIENMNKNEMKLLLRSIFEDNGIATTVLHYDKPRKDDEHPTMKPVSLFGDHIRNSSRVGDIVLDPFGGSGTTLIACEQLGRRCRMVELDPVYCDVIVDRWEKFTGQKAKR